RDRADFIASRATSSLPHSETFEYSELRARVFGSVVVVTGRGATTGAGTAFQVRFTDVWAQREGQWKLVAMQRTDIAAQASPLDFVLGTWKGTSTCVGDRPACKNETVVYRFVAIDGHPGQVRQLADKILDGKRVPMGSLVFDVDARDGTLHSEFTRGNTHGVWSYTVAGDSLTGALDILPDGSRGRDVQAHRVKVSAVPEATPL